MARLGIGGALVLVNCVGGTTENTSEGSDTSTEEADEGSSSDDGTDEDQDATDTPTPAETSDSSGEPAEPAAPQGEGTESDGEEPEPDPDSPEPNQPQQPEPAETDSTTDGESDAPAEPTDSAGTDTAETDGDEPAPVASDPRDAANVYFFGHSLVDWAQEHTQVGTAMCEVASSNAHGCCADGEWPASLAPTTFDTYELPPQPNHGHVPSCWDGWDGSFASANIDTVVMTEANFHYESPVDVHAQAGLALAQYVRSNDPDIPVYLYEHWPRMADGVSFESWKNEVHARYHTWHAELQDAINTSLDGPDLKLIPVGRSFSLALREIPDLAAMPGSDLFVDDSHGTGPSYFISGLVHYMVIYRRRPATDASALAELPDYLPPAVADNYTGIVDLIWDDLQSVVDANGISRLW